MLISWFDVIICVSFWSDLCGGSICAVFILFYFCYHVVSSVFYNIFVVLVDFLVTDVPVIGYSLPQSLAETLFSVSFRVD